LGRHRRPPTATTARHPPTGLPPPTHTRPRLLHRHPAPAGTGCSWDVAARLTPAGKTTLRNRRTAWLQAGVFNKLVEESIAGYDKIIGLDLSEVAVDGSLHKAPCGGEGTGPNPTDRAKIGWK
jgi:hypothetical protein